MYMAILDLKEKKRNKPFWFGVWIWILLKNMARRMTKIHELNQELKKNGLNQINFKIEFWKKENWSLIQKKTFLIIVSVEGVSNVSQKNLQPSLVFCDVRL